MAERNRTLALSDDDVRALEVKLGRLESHSSVDEIQNKVICQDMLEAARYLPRGFVDVLFLDPPYNLSKKFDETVFKKRGAVEYSQILDQWIGAILHTLKPTASIYICGDWHTSTSIHEVASRYFHIRNRITWEREKGRGALSNFSG